MTSLGAPRVLVGGGCTRAGAGARLRVMDADAPDGGFDALSPDSGRERVVVGVGGGEATINALRFAYEEALERDATLDAVLVRAQPVVMADPLGVAATVGTEVSASEAAARLDLLLREALGDAADDERITRTILDGDPVKQLCAESQGAAMLVVGAATGLQRWLPGSVARLCEAKSPAAVVVVRKDTQVIPRRGRRRAE